MREALCLDCEGTGEMIEDGEVQSCLTCWGLGFVERFGDEFEDLMPEMWGELDGCAD